MKYDPETFDTEQEFKLIRKAKYIASGSLVSKPSGTVEYTLKEKLTLYSDVKGEKPIEIDGPFIVDQRGGITKISPDVELKEIFNLEQMIEFLQELQYIEDFEDK